MTGFNHILSGFIRESTTPEGTQSGQLGGIEQVHTDAQGHAHTLVHEDGTLYTWQGDLGYQSVTPQNALAFADANPLVKFVFEKAIGFSSMRNFLTTSTRKGAHTDVRKMQRLLDQNPQVKSFFDIQVREGVRRLGGVNKWEVNSGQQTAPEGGKYITAPNGKQVLVGDTAIVSADATWIDIGMDSYKWNSKLEVYEKLNFESDVFDLNGNKIMSVRGGTLILIQLSDGSLMKLSEVSFSTQTGINAEGHVRNMGTQESNNIINKIAQFYYPKNDGLYKLEQAAFPFLASAYPNHNNIYIGLNGNGQIDL